MLGESEFRQIAVAVFGFGGNLLPLGIETLAGFGQFARLVSGTEHFQRFFVLMDENVVPRTVASEVADIERLVVLRGRRNVRRHFGRVRTIDFEIIIRVDVLEELRRLRTSCGGRTESNEK